MNVKIYPRALKVIDKIAAFVESKNTPGSGYRYADRFKKVIQQLAQPNVQYSICNNISLARLKYSCARYNDWVIVFKINGEDLTVYRILYASSIL